MRNTLQLAIFAVLLLAPTLLAAQSTDDTLEPITYVALVAQPETQQLWL